MNKVRGPVHGGRGRQKPRPLFPPGELPLFGPPPAYMRRPPGPPPPPIPPARGPMGPPFGGDYGPPPPPPLRPPYLGPPIPPLPHHPMNMRRRPGPPPPPMPLLQAPIMPPRHLPFMRGRPMPRLAPGKKPGKKPKNKRNKSKPNPPKTEDTSKKEQKIDEKILEGPWINDEIKAEIEKMNELKKTSETSKAEADIKSFNEQKEKVLSMAKGAKAESKRSLKANAAADGKAESNNSTEDQK